MTTTASLIRPSARVGRKRRLPISTFLAIVYVLLVVVTSIFGSLFMPYPPLQQDLYSIGTTPSPDHLLGADFLGRDVFSRIIAGSSTALLGPLVVAVSGLVVSSLLGIYAGYSGGLADSVIMRIVDFMFALPGLLIAIVVVALLGGGYWMAIAVLSFLNVQGDIRIVRSAALRERNLAYIEAARAVGVPPWRIMFRHIFPNISPILVSDLAIDFSGALVALSGLAFLGLGSDIGAPEWGTLLADGQQLLFINPSAALVPAVLIILLAVSMNLIGDWLYERYSSR
ncbi:ABC transporter permease [Salinibacterium sp.]|uniref:ABC transporter permease n=1 Tax=Salinibacterium sp. TaxID=1915057 RepID=UPI00286C02D0|nr:ABC transporter permease [Salinibacterium sp.]